MGITHPGTPHFITKLLVQKILERAVDYDWSLQGFGMFRLYLTKDIRLQVWDTRFRFPNVSDIHDHPRHFVSRIIAGTLRNAIYVPDTGVASSLFWCQELKCGPGGGLVKSNKPSPIKLSLLAPVLYKEGDSYFQRQEVLHRTIPADSTVTIIERPSDMEDSEVARVCWYYGTEWGTAEPRPATKREVEVMARSSLRKWFNPYETVETHNEHDHGKKVP